MPYRIFIFVVIAITHISKPVYSQTNWQDDFADSNFTSNPAWVGDTSLFVVNASKQLQLNAPAAAGNAHLVTQSTASILASWQFYFQLDFNPSSNNFAQVYLMSSKQNLNTALNGYFIRIGGSSDDRISLYKQSGTTSQLIAESAADFVDQANVQMQIRVTRDSLKNWVIFADTALTNTFFSIASGNDADHLNGTYFGVKCTFTSTRADKFYFDDFAVSGKQFLDSVSPTIVNQSFPSGNSIRLTFSESIDSTSASNRFNYILLGQGLNPIAARWVAANPRRVEIEFGQNFTNGQQLNLRIEGVEDQAGNEMKDSTLALTFFRPNYRSVVFNEIMADPEPVVALPPAEYIELFNTENVAVSFNDWRFVADDDTFDLPNYTLQSGEYVVLLSSADTASFDSIPYISLPLGNSWLRNNGEPLHLLDENGETIDFLAFDRSWYQNEQKADGGWSLEQIVSSLACNEKKNWCASNTNKGGTPGRQNLPERTFNPESNALQAVYFESVNEVKLQFIEGLNPNLLPQLASTASISTIHYAATEPNSIVVAFNQNLPESGIAIYIQRSNSCTGFFEPDTFIVGLPNAIEEGDIVLNELLFNPKSNGSDFIELWNTSSKTILLADLRIGAADNTGFASDIQAIGEAKQLFLPKSYLVISEDVASICITYSCDKIRFYSTNNLPSMPDNEGGVALLRANTNVLEWVYYNDDWHHPSLSNTEGVSLERVSPNLKPTQAASWHSAASNVGYATPGFLNSQFQSSAANNAQFTLSSQTISPNNDGFNDVLNIQYNLPQGSQLSMRIFSMAGIPIRTLLNNALTSTGEVIWNGQNDENQLARTGIYLILAEWFTPNGESGQTKLTVALSQ